MVRHLVYKMYFLIAVKIEGREEATSEETDSYLWIVGQPALPR